MVEAMDTLGDIAFLLLLDRAKQRNDSGSKATREAIGSTLLVYSSSSKTARRRGRETELCSSGRLCCEEWERERGGERHLIEPQSVTRANWHMNWLFYPSVRSPTIQIWNLHVKALAHENGVFFSLKHVK